MAKSDANNNCWLDKSAWPTPGEVYMTAGKTTPVLELEFHGRFPAPLRHGPSRDNFPPTTVTPDEERGDVDVVTETGEVVVVETTETETLERPVQPSTKDLITLPPEQAFIRSLGHAVSDFSPLRQVRFRGEEEESDGEKSCTVRFDPRQTVRFQEKSTRMEVGDLEAFRLSRSSEKGRSRKRRHRIRSSGGMTDR